MAHIWKYFLILLFLAAGTCEQIVAQEVSGIHSIIKPQTFAKGGDVFGLRNFIENKGQFDGRLPGKEKILFIYECEGERIYFTPTGLVYEFIKRSQSDEERFEALEHGRAEKEDKHYFVNMNWIGGQATSVTGDLKQKHYFTYGTAEYNSACYKKILYKEVYRNIDIEFLIPADKNYGIKYNVILNPGADLSKLEIRYSGDVRKINKTDDGDVIIKTRGSDITEHAPVSFLENGTPLNSEFTLDQLNVLHFQVHDLGHGGSKIIIDPWVTSTNGFSNNNNAYDVDFDFGGNTFIYGGTSNYKVAMYNSGGTHQWTFGGFIISPSWGSSSYASNIAVDRFTGKCYTGQGFEMNGATVVRLDVLGNYDNFISTVATGYQEMWEFGFHCSTANIFVFGGSTSAKISAATITSVNPVPSCSNFQPNHNFNYQDIANYAIDDLGNIFVIYAAGFGLNNQLCLVNSTFNGNVWTAPSTYSSLNEAANRNAYQPASGSGNGFNCLAVNGNYLYYYDGYNIAAYNKLSGTQVASTTVQGMVVKRQGGIAVDDCDVLYVGGNGSILTYSFNGTSFSTLTPISLAISTGTQNVHDIKFDRNTKTLYVCGTDFVGTYVAAESLNCPTGIGICVFNQAGLGASTTSITCATLGSATVQLNGGIGPYSYTWVPSGVTGSVISGLIPGTYTVIVYDQGANHTYTTTTTFIPSVPLTGTVPNFNLPCNSINNATATVQNLSGGSGSQSYLWTSGSGTQTTAIATGLGPGTHTVKVTDNLTKCQYVQIFSIGSPPALTLNVHVNTPSVCAGKFITLTPLIAGGTPPSYSYSWAPTPASPVNITTQQAGGNYIYTLTAYDSQSCAITRTVALTFFNTPTLSVNAPSVCPGIAATLTVSGANTYTWNNTLTTNTFVASPAVTTIYTVSGSNALCSSSRTVPVFVYPTPVPTLSSNSPVCNGKTLNLKASGALSVLWQGPQNFTSSLLQPAITSASVSNSGVYTATLSSVNSCTASSSITVQINPTPAIALIGDTVCVNTLLALKGFAPPGCSFAWSGPNNFTSAVQNPVINPVTLAATGLYTLTITDVNSCQNTAQVHSRIVDLPVVSFTSNEPLCAGKTLSLNASATTGAINYLWTGPNGFTSSQISPVITNVSPAGGGVFNLMAINGPCSVSVAKQLLIYPLPQLVLPATVDVCETKTINLNPSTSSNIVSTVWKGPAGFSSGAANLKFYPASQAHAGNYYLTITDNHSCVTSSAVTVGVMQNPVIRTTNVTVCFNEPAMLKASGASTYQWYGPGVFATAGDSIQLMHASNKNAETYTVTGTAVNSCSSVATVTLKTIPLPVAGFLVLPSSSLCLNSEVTFRGSRAASYEWHGPEKLIFSGQEISFRLNYQGYAGTYTLFVTDASGCKSSTQQDIVIYNLPTGKFSGSLMDECVPFCSDFTFAPSSASVTSSWNVNGKNYSGTSFNHCFKSEGSIPVRGALYDAQTGCRSAVEYVVEARRKPVASFTFAPLHPVENEDVVIFTADTQDPDINKFRWFFDSNTEFNSRSEVATHLFETEGNYPVALVVQNKWNCSDTLVQAIKIDPDFLVFVPNIFTPNTDNLNEQFKPVLRAVKIYQLRIFDRWGEMIYATSDPASGWDGTYKGAECKSDVYVWKIELTSINGEAKSLKGHVTLYR